MFLDGALAATSSPVVFRGLEMRAMAWNTVAHEHAGTRRGFKYLIDAFNFERGTFLVGPSSDDVGHSLALFPGYIFARIVWGRFLFICWP